MTREEAIKKVRQMSLPKETMEILEALAPELNESEDKRIIEEIKFAVMQMPSERQDTKQRCLSWLEKQKEQKPAELSEGTIRRGIREVGLTQHQIDWLKKNVCPQPKQEWSEEDDWKRKELIQYLEEKGDYRTVWMTWLKSLRPQSHWKPSEEQMRALIEIICLGEISYVGQEEELISLKNNLKKLM